MAKPKRRKPGHRKRMAYLRGKLLERRRRLLSEIEQEIRVGANRDHSEPADVVDMATNSSHQEIILRIAEMSSGEVVRIDHALNKMKDGTYGICEICGRRIPAARLKVMPTASMCVSCQGELEAEEAEEQSFEAWHRVGTSEYDDVPEEITIHAEEL